MKSARGFIQLTKWTASGGETTRHIPYGICFLIVLLSAFAMRCCKARGLCLGREIIFKASGGQGRRQHQPGPISHGDDDVVARLARLKIHAPDVVAVLRARGCECITHHCLDEVQVGESQLVDDSINVWNELWCQLD